MPYGFTKARIKAGNNPATIKFHVLVINQLFKYLMTTEVAKNQTHEIDLNKIKPSHIKGFLDQQAEKNQNSTIYRKQSNLKVFFDYLHVNGYVKTDIMVKFDYFETKKRKQLQNLNDNEKMEIMPLPYGPSIKNDQPIDFTYLEMYKIKEELLVTKMPAICHILAVLYLQGIQLSDMFNLTIDDFEYKEKTKTPVFLKLNYISKKSGLPVEIVFTSKRDIKVLVNAIIRAKARNTPYLINQCSRKEQKYIQSSSLNCRAYVQRITSQIGMPFRTQDICITYVAHLHFNDKLTIEEIVNKLGRTPKQVRNLLNDGIERITEKTYNEQMSLAL